MSDNFTHRDSRLLDEVLNQGRSCVCWAISLTRQMTAVFRKREIISGEDSLSVQYLINCVRETKQRRLWKGGVKSIKQARVFLTQGGSVMEQDCPLTFSLDTRNAPNAFEGKRRFLLSRFIVHKITDGRYDGDETAFEEHMLESLRESPITAIVRTFGSFKELDREVFIPNDQERRDPSRWTKEHSMLLVGSGFDEETDMGYWEFQDSHGIGRGDAGYIRVARGMGIVKAFVEMEPFSDEKGEEKDDEAKRSEPEEEDGDEKSREHEEEEKKEKRKRKREHSSQGTPSRKKAGRRRSRRPTKGVIGGITGFKGFHSKCG